MAILSFHMFDQAGNSANGRFEADSVSVDTGDSFLDDADFEGTSLEGATIEGVSVITLDGNTLELIKITASGAEYYADVDGTDLPGLGLLQGAAAALEDAEDDGEFDDGGPVAVCFARGTLIETPDGPRKVEDLRAGDQVITLDKGARPIVWIGHSTVPARGALRPVRICAGALGKNAPSTDLIVSPRHRVIIKGWRAEVLFGQEEVLATAEGLINDSTIRPEYGIETVEYHHILFNTHEIIISNGTPSESFNPSSIALDNVEADVREEIYTLFPELRESPKAFGKAARMVVTGKEARLIAE